MNEVDLRLRAAKTLRLDPQVVSPRGTWFAWRPVRLVDQRWVWMRRVGFFRPLGLFNEYYQLSEFDRKQRGKR